MLSNNLEALYEKWKRDLSDHRPAHEALGLEWEQFHDWVTTRTISNWEST